MWVAFLSVMSIDEFVYGHELLTCVCRLMRSRFLPKSKPSDSHDEPNSPVFYRSIFPPSNYTCEAVANSKVQSDSVFPTVLSPRSPRSKCWSCRSYQTNEKSKIRQQLQASTSRHNRIIVSVNGLYSQYLRCLSPVKNPSIKLFNIYSAFNFT